MRDLAHSASSQADGLGEEHWLDRYAQNYFSWRHVRRDGRTILTRPLGLVETSFAFDGIDHGGRADVTTMLTVHLRHEHQVTESEIRERIERAWACVRVQHVLLMAKAVGATGKDRSEEDQMAGADSAMMEQRWFEVEVPKDVEELLKDGRNTLTIMDGGAQRGDQIDSADFYRHASNAGRLINPEVSLSRLIILPFSLSRTGHTTLRMSFTVSHEITDGMSTNNWLSHFLRLLGTSPDSITSQLKNFSTAEEISKRLPIAQEDLYLTIPGSRARQRWFWAILRVLLHVRRPLRAGLQNPLRKPTRTYPELPPTFSDIFDYSTSTRPELPSGHLHFTIPPKTMTTLTTQARAAHTTIGASLFALSALCMSSIAATTHPSLTTLFPTHTPLILSFPMNPKPYYNYTGPSESCMLSFGDNFLLPLLPSTIPVRSRFRLLAKQCQQKLSRYQKKRVSNPSEKLSLQAYTPARLLAQGYITQLDRGWGMRRPNGQRRSPYNPHGELKASREMSTGTNGVSNVGPINGFFGREAIRVSEEERDVRIGVERVVEMRGGVRARDGEFLVGFMSDERGQRVLVSYDAGVMDEARVRRWQELMEGLLVRGEELEEKARL